jgi:pimeloyl-ACP methyl ester carboxylesterase
MEVALNLLSLGTTQRRLFAIHDPPATGARRVRAAVICNPAGAELAYAHRTLRHLALRLSRRGFHVVRFDYFGTGDSGGDDADASVQGMLDDTALAIEAAQEASSARQVTLIGLRMGAVIAAQAAARHPRDVEAVVLWDPVDDAPGIGELPPRALVIATDESRRAPEAVHVAAPCCWTDSITISGALPVAVFQRMEEWLR